MFTISLYGNWKTPKARLQRMVALTTTLPSMSVLHLF